MQLRSFLELNEAMALRYLVELLQDVEAKWPDPDARRLALARLLEVLDWASTHRSPRVQELGRLDERIPEDPSYHQFMSLAVPIERNYGRGVADPEISARSQDRAEAHGDALPLVLVIDNLRSAFNVGSILRISECLGIGHVYLCGYTATPEQEKIKKASMGTEAFVPWTWEARTMDVLGRLKAQGFTLYALETSDRSQSLDSFRFPDKPTALVFGNERFGLEADVLQVCDGLLEIECWGRKNSLNVGVALGMACFEWRRQWQRSRSSAAPT